MPTAHRPLQTHLDVVSLAGWRPDDDNPVGPQGAKPKRIVICPDPAPHPFLLAGHRYIFKMPSGSKAQQIWSEVISYEIARDRGVQVPPAFLAYDPEDEASGVLVEFFHGHRWDPPLRFVHAIERFQGLGMPLNQKRGSLRDNLGLTRKHRVPEWQDWWAKTIAFDALIGNTDRHSENWGFLIDQSKAGHAYSLAPVFDNGTSLGHVIRDADLSRAVEPAKLQAFLARGKHHFGWLPDDALEADHVALCARFVAVYAAASAPMRSVIHLNDGRIEDVMAWCRQFNFPVAFTQARAEFVAAQLKARRDALAAVVEA